MRVWVRVWVCCAAPSGREVGRASAGDLLQRAQRGLQGDRHRVADGLRVVRHRVAGTLGKQREESQTNAALGVSKCFLVMWMSACDESPDTI